MSVKAPFTGKRESLRIILAFIFFSVIFLINTSNISATTVTKAIGGYTLRNVNGQLVPVGNINVLLKIVNAGTAGSTTEYRILPSDANGHYGPVSKDFYCDEGYVEVYARVLLSNGQVEGGTAYSAAQLPCSDTEDWSDRFSVTSQGDAQNNPQNAGDSCFGVGEPVNVTNGNMWLKQTDYNLPGTGLPINVTRTYNSMVQRSGIFGAGWSTDFDQYITGSAATTNLILGNGQTVFFTDAGNNTYLPITGNFNAQLVATGPNGSGMYTVTYRDGRVHHFVNYRLAWMKDRNGNQTTLNYNQYNQLTSVTDASGRTVTFTINPSNGLIEQMSDSTGVIATYEYNIGNVNTLKTVTYADGSKYKFQYDTSVWGRYPLTTVKDANDNILETHLYDSEGRATTSEKHGGVEKYTLDYSHIMDTVPYTTVTDALGRATKYTIDKTKGRNVVTKTEGNCNCGGGSEVTTYEYDDKLNLKKRIDALNRQTTYTYNATGDPLTMTDVWGTSTFTYNTFGQVLTFTDRMNGTWTNTYDTNGNLLTSKDSLNNITTVTYPATNNKGLPDSIKDARNNITKFKWFSGSGLLEEIEDANGKKTNFTYDGRGRTKTVTNALTHTTTYNYFDDAQRKIEKIYPNADKITYKYDVRRLLESVTDERGKITSYEFDSAYRLKKITDPLSHVKEFDYDLMSNLKWSKDALGNQTDFIYDDYNRLKEVQYPLAETGATRLVEKFEYDGIGRIKKFYDTANRLTTYGYDDTNRTNTVTNAELEVTTTKYNQRFQTTEVKDALNQIYTFTYDSLGRQLTQTRAGGVMSYEYDAVGNQTKRTDYTGRVTDYQYDNLNRLKKILYGGQSSTGTSPNEESVYTYDDISRLKTATNETGTVTLNYDNLNRMTSTVDVFGHTVAYEYDLTSTVNQKRLKFDGAMYAIYNFDDADRLSNVVNSSDSTTVSYGYDNADRLTSKTLPNSVTTTYEYDGMSRLKRLKDVSSTATLFDRQYSYNNADQISQIVEPTNTRTIGYDLVNRLTSVTASNNQNESYTFDDAGNRTASHKSASYAYQTGQYNRLVSTATASYNYDANGNMVTKGEGSNFWRFTWDYENRLTAASTRKHTVRYKYDALGRRVRRNLSGSREDTKYIYDGQDVLVDDNSGTLTKYLNGAGIDNKLRVQTGSDVKYFLTDHLGSTNGMTDASGNLTSSAAYDSFGNVTGNLSTRYQFTGREFDNFTGLHYYRARFYDSQIGRFISEDPIGLAGGINQFGYVDNDPMSFTDPSGLVGWGSRAANWVDERINYAQDAYGFDPIIGYSTLPGQTPSPIKIFELSRSFSDLLRVGEGLACAIFKEDENIWGRAAYIAMDIKRASDIFVTLAGPFAGRVGGGKMPNVPCLRCFEAETEVQTEDGLKPIENIEVGDKVLSYNEDTGFLEYQEVLQKFSRYADDIYGVSVEGESKPLGVTSEHPFFVRVYGARNNLLSGDEGEWRETRHLQISDEIKLANGTWARVSEAKFKGEGQVYNFEVAKNHNYFVGDLRLLTHNCRRGNTATRNHLDQVRDDFLQNNPDYTHVGGGRDAITGSNIPEEYLRPLDGGTRGGSYPDLTFQAPDGSRVRINSVDYLKRTGIPSDRELINGYRIFEQTGEPIYLIKKPQ